MQRRQSPVRLAALAVNECYVQENLGFWGESSSARCKSAIARSGLTQSAKHSAAKGPRAGRLHRVGLRFRHATGPRCGRPCASDISPARTTSVASVCSRRGLGHVRSLPGPPHRGATGPRPGGVARRHLQARLPLPVEHVFGLRPVAHFDCGHALARDSRPAAIFSLRGTTTAERLRTPGRQQHRRPTSKLQATDTPTAPAIATPARFLRREPRRGEKCTEISACRHGDDDTVAEAG